MMIKAIDSLFGKGLQTIDYRLAWPPQEVQASLLSGYLSKQWSHTIQQFRKDKGWANFLIINSFLIS